MKTPTNTPSHTATPIAADQMIMHSKLQKPQLPENYVARLGLFAKLEGWPVILVSASAGSGKSTAVSAWLNHKIQHVDSVDTVGKVDEAAIPYLWYRLDSWDNDLDVFLKHLAYGIDTALNTPEGTGLQALLEARAAMADDALLRAIVAKLEHHPGPAIWIFDDYHEVTHPVIHQFVTLLLQHLGPTQQLCIVTREDPPILLAKVRASGRLSTLREVDLRMSREEAEALLDPRLSAEQVSFVHGRTEGWVAGLQLTGQTLRSIEGAADVTGFIEAYRDSKDYMMDYLVEEVLARQPEPIRSFLVRTSVFEDFCPELVDYTLGLEAGESARILKHLVRVNCFVMPLLDGSWLRYHQLFKEVLRQRLEKPTTELHRRAGTWFEAKGQLQEAIHYYLEGSPLEAARLIEGLWATMDLELRSNAWLDLAKRLPKDIVWNSPVLTAGWGWSLLNAGAMSEAVPWLDRAQQLYDQGQSINHDDVSNATKVPSSIYIFDQLEYHQLPLSLLSARAYISASKGDYAAVMAFNEALRASAQTIPYQRLWVMDTYVSTIQWSLGNLDAAIEAMTRAHQTFGQPGQQFPVMVRESLVWVIAAIQIEKGDLSVAKRTLEDAIHRVKDLAIAPMLIARYQLYLAEIASIRGDFKSAFSALKESEAQGLSLDFIDWRESYEHLLARLYTVQGLFELARTSIQRGREFAMQNPLPETMSFDDLQLLVDAAMGTVTGDTLEAPLRRLSIDLPSYTQEFNWKVRLRYLDLSKLDLKAQAYRLCLALLERAKSQNRHLHALDYELLAARLSPNERTRQAHEAEANRLSGPNQLVLPHFLWGQRTWTEVDRGKQANTELAEPLTNRELELLGLIAEGLSNEEISQQLFITVSTVKSYNNSLYAKLGVKRRTEAIYKARDLGLI